MSRYIDADVLKKQVCLDKFEKITHSPERRMVTFDEVSVFIDTYAPSIDIVRCNECKKHKVVPFEGNACFYWCKFHEHAVNADDFCSYGERRGP